MSGLWYDENFQDDTRLGLRAIRTHFSGRSEYQKVEIFETKRFGRVLAIDEIFMTSERDEYFYHEMLVHPALTCHADPKRVLVIGGGDGGTVREVLRHNVDKVVMIEIDELVVRASQEHLPTIGTAWDDPRLEVRFDDGIKYVCESDDEKYDIVLLDGTDPVGPGEVLFEKRFYEGCKRMLKPGGVFALQSETVFLFEDVFVETQQKLRELFAQVHPYFGPVPIYASGQWSWTMASDSRAPADADVSRIEALEAHTKYYCRDIHKGAFAMPNHVRKRLAAL